MDPTKKPSDLVMAGNSVNIAEEPSSNADSTQMLQQLSQSSNSGQIAKMEASSASPNDDNDDEDVDDDDNNEGKAEEEGRWSTHDSTYLDAPSGCLTTVDSSLLSSASGDDNVSDVCSSVPDSENADVAPMGACGAAFNSTSKSCKRSRQPSIMMGYKKRRKTQHAAATKHNDDGVEATDTQVTMMVSVTKMEVETIESASSAEPAAPSDGNKSESFQKSLQRSSSEENVFESSATSMPSMRKYSNVTSKVVGADKFCWICHKNGNGILKCIACPRVYHSKCNFQTDVTEGPKYDPSNFHCPECSAVLKADNVNTRSPVLVTVNLEQLCTLLKHLISILKSQKDSHYFWGPVDTKEFPHYRQYVVYPMDISLLEKNIKNKIYGCTEAFLADVKWIVHNSIVFNSGASKITNVAKNLLKICKREILEIEACAECYYNSLVRKDTWFIEVCKKPHLLVWARLKGYPPWPAKVMKCKDGNVDCRFFGAHDKAWVPLKDCFLYSKISPQPMKVKRGSHLEDGIQELEKHIKKLRDKFGVFTYPAARIAYHPSQELEQLQMMLPNYDPNCSTRSTKYLIHPDRIRNNFQPKTLFKEGKEKPVKKGDETPPDSEAKQSEEADSDETLAEEMEKTSDSPPRGDFGVEDSSFESCSEAETTVAPEDMTPSRSMAVARIGMSSPSPTETSFEPSPLSHKLVSVKNIESINASITSTPNSSPRSVKSLEVTSPDSAIDEFKVTPPTEAASVASVTSKSPQTIPSCRLAPLPKTSYSSSCESVSSDVDVDLNKVKDEPLEGQELPTNDVDVVVKKCELPAGSGIQLERSSSCGSESSSSASTRTKAKRPTKPVEVQPAKKVKPDTKCRTVNITENVTLSLINQTKPVELPKGRSPSVVLQQKPLTPISAPVVPLTLSVTAVTSAGIFANASSIVSGHQPCLMRNISSPNDTNMLHSDVTTKCIISPLAINRPNTKVQPRIVNRMSPSNGVLSVSTKPGVTVTPSRSSVKTSESYNDFFNKAMNECLADCRAQFRKIFESTLDKLVGKGDLRARIVSLKKEIEALKRNHELVMDEMRRDYEVQIAELRATSVAKLQFDLAAERLKFVQEKERAVKETKSKQWCSNCQKIANYYCCWNTAYCDFECQKEHWIQHIHVCKNDVKKKTTESSESEPPKIMMQSDINNCYPIRGCDKTDSMFLYGNVGAPIVSSHSLSRSNFNRPGTKVSSLVRISRPFLPRVPGTVSGPPSFNSSSTSEVVVQNTRQNSKPSALDSIGNNAASKYSPLYQK